MRYVGYAKTDNGGLSKEYSKTPAGIITANTLDVIVNGVTYTVTIPTITIDNSY
jgi:hypothetical protein